MYDYLKQKSALVNQHLGGLVSKSSSPSYYQELFDAACYSLFSGGKRIRPILTLATAEIFGCEQKTALGPACALEMLHTYSLIHDDLPCMDNDDFRRGQPTLHKKFSEGHAVLTGDYLLTYAFSVIARDPLLSNQKKISLISVLAERAGAEGMIGGQVMDIKSFGKNLELNTLQQIHNQKTGSLISAAVEFGGIIASVSAENLSILKQFGHTIGLAFQIVDDILDVTSSLQKHGRELSSDTLNDKLSYPSILGLEESKIHASELLKKANQLLEKLPCDCSVLKDLASFIVNRNS